MASGHIPIGEVGSSPATAAAAQGLDVEVIWILDDINNAEQLAVSSKSGVADLAGVKGKKIATPFVSTSHYQLTYALDKAGSSMATSGHQPASAGDPRRLGARRHRGRLRLGSGPGEDQGLGRQGDPLVSRRREKGAPTFDAIIVNRAWAEKNRTSSSDCSRRSTRPMPSIQRTSPNTCPIPTRGRRSRSRRRDAGRRAGDAGRMPSRRRLIRRRPPASAAARTARSPRRSLRRRRFSRPGPYHRRSGRLLPVRRPGIRGGGGEVIGVAKRVASERRRATWRASSAFGA